MPSLHASVAFCTQCLMAGGYIPGFTGALAYISEEALVEAGVETAADSGLGGRFKLAFNCRKDGYYAKR